MVNTLKVNTKQQDLGNMGENYVRKSINCPKCKRLSKTLRVLPTNFRCADLICDFCGYLAQMKMTSVSDVKKCPQNILGAAWEPQRARREAGIYFLLFIVLLNLKERQKSVFYLPADLQTSLMFQPRTPLSETAKRAGWQGFMINVANATGEPIRIL
jgi:hypothetical protein